MDSKKVGVIAIILASLMWALEPVFAKLAYHNSDFLQTSAIRAIVVALVATLYVLITNKADFKVTKTQLPKLVYIAVVGTVIADLLYFFALTKISVVNAVLIGHMQPIFFVLIGFLILKEDKLTKYDYIGISIMILAGLMVMTKSFSNLAILKFGTWGDLLVLIATICWTTTAIVMRKYLRELNAGTITFYRYGIGAIIFITYLLFTSALFLPNIYQILVGVIVAIGTILYYHGLKRIKAAQVGALELVTPFFAVLFGFLVLGERATIMQLVGIILLVVGVYFLSKKEQKD